MESDQRRIVHFRDFLSQDLIEKIDAAQSPVPLFSPTQVPNSTMDSSDNGSTSSMQGLSQESDKENLAPQFLLPMSNLTPKTPSRTIPLPRNSSAKQAPRFGLSPIDEEMFFSPAQSNQSLHDILTPNLSATPYKSLPRMEMLRLDYIQQCEDASTLSSIVKVLQEENRAPSLLRAATSRLKELDAGLSDQSLSRQLNKSKPGDEMESSPGPLVTIQQSTQPPSPTPTASSHQTSSLFFSIDSDELHVKINRHIDEESLAPEPLPPISITPQQIHIPNQTALEMVPSDQTEVNPHLVSAYSRPIETVDDNERGQLIYKIEFLTQQLKNTETMRWHDQQDFLEKVEALERSKEETERDIQALRAQFKQSDETRQELIRSIERQRLEKKRLSETIHEQQQAWLARNQEQEKLQRKLHSHILTLREKLKSVETDRQGLEMKCCRLNESLLNAKKNLLAMKKERDTTLREIIRFTDREASGINISSLTSDEFSKIIHEFQSKAVASRGAIGALTEALKKAEADRARAVRSYHKVYALYKQEQTKSQHFGSSNEALTEQIGRLSKELTESQAHIDKLQQSANIQVEKKFREREEKYQKEIKKLKSQVCLQESRVPIALYRTALAEKRTTTLEVEKQREQVKKLSLQLQEVRLSHAKYFNESTSVELGNQAKSVSKRASIGEMEATKLLTKSRASMRIDQPTTPTDAQECVAKTPKRINTIANSENICPDTSEMKREGPHTALSRRKKLVQAGGLRALKEHYRNVRSPLQSAVAPRKPLAALN